MLNDRKSQLLLQKKTIISSQIIKKFMQGKDLKNFTIILQQKKKYVLDETNKNNVWETLKEKIINTVIIDILKNLENLKEKLKHGSCSKVK